MSGKPPYLSTPDGRYFLVNARLWRKINPALSEEERARFTKLLMQARRGIYAAKQAGDRAAESKWRRQVSIAKQKLGERGPPWWTDGAPDYNRRMAKNTPYADWFLSLDI